MAPAPALPAVKSTKDAPGRVNVPVRLAGVVVHPGDWIYADEDGIIVSRERLHA
jgi:regulator of ribonuclease activity A